MKRSAIFAINLFLIFVACTPFTSKTKYAESGRGNRVVPYHEGHLRRQFANHTAPNCGDTAIETKAPLPNAWGGLSDQEAAAVISWLFKQPDLNLTVSSKAGPWDNSILLVEQQRPNKTDALPYLAGSGAAPPRFAHVVLDIRATESPHFADILVGPLPIQPNATSWAPLDFSNTRKTQGRTRNLAADGFTLFEKLIIPATASVADITFELYGGAFQGQFNDTLMVRGIDPLGQDENGRITSWYMFSLKGTTGFDSWTLTPLGLFFMVDQTGRDPAQWKVLGWFYNNVWYDSTKAFRSAFFAPGFEKLPTTVDGKWTSTDQQGPVLPRDTLSPPVAIAPAGPRYSVDQKEKYVEWMDFSFYVGFSHDTGLTLYNIKYKGERVIYELGMQEALAHYAGADPFQSGTSFLDGYYGFGPTAWELVEGYDCPAYATYMNTTYYVAETTHTNVNSICLFEFTADYPAQRHSAWDYVSVSKNTYFSLRSVSTLGNYDYMFTYSFYLDGTINVEVRASGYILGAYYANNEDYGWRIHDSLSGSMHDHVLNFKADIDILGTANTVQLVSNTPTTEVYPWSQGKPRNTMKLTRRFIQSEDESRLNWDANGVTQVIVVNKNATNAQGVSRGYRIAPSFGTAHLTIENSSSLLNSANWANHDIQFTRQHDTEPRSSHTYNTQDTANPPIDFNAFFNGESLVQEDLVAWINLGMHHVPHTGDLPNTIFTTAHSGVSFMPLNYLAGDPSRQSVNQVRINYPFHKVKQVETFGQSNMTCSPAVDVGAVNAGLWNYGADFVVRKYPFDPNQQIGNGTGPPGFPGF
ncbi:membrane copper amine oxidase [Polyplosphaeria fusca]|uniref:Amine oxidase n=1 Tax=Polyplosphaeria fusca TaxID=682080 RepID=A0A9P4UU23_9PLEO|nr:membrane copper amine oxidase [Polyplosphaeria fusca]